MQEGQGRSTSISARTSAEVIQESYPQLSETQRKAVSQILSSRDQVMALEGVAGSGKTTSLAAIREVAQRNGYKVEGFAPTSRAAQKLSESGIESGTLQRHLSSPREDQASGKKLYVLDESSLASTKQMNEFLNRLGGEDRVLLVGDTRQHQAVEAGRPYQQLREAGLQTARLEEIVRQKEPRLREVVEQLSRGEVKVAIDNLYSQNRLHEIGDRAERVAKIADEYSKKPEGTLVVSPDNQSRIEVNNAIRRKMQETGRVGLVEQNYKVLVPRQEVTSADRRWAGQYEPGNVIRYTKGSKELGITSGEYARVEAVEEKKNQLTVARHNGERVSYDPRRLQGVTVYRETERSFSKGERVQFTAPNKELGVANRELATIESSDRAGNLRLKLESGRAVEFNVEKNPHLDYGYAVTSHSSQGQTADRVLIHIDTSQASEKLVNRRLAYVAVSRGRHDAQIYTNDGLELREALSRDVSKTTALEVEGQLQRGNTQRAMAQTGNSTERSEGKHGYQATQGQGQASGGGR
jgi:ATP-dependent exoDNAse (exonuclease V) alpha subunit